MTDYTTAEAMQLVTITPTTARLGGRPVLSLSSPQGKSAERILRICFVTSHIAGPAKTAGLGTAYMALSELLAADGHEVTILYLRGDRSDQFSIDHWITDYAAKKIRLIPLLSNDSVDPSCPYYLRRPYEAYLWLKDRTFDLIHYSDCYGVGYYIAQAKHQGRTFLSTLLCAGTHGSVLWLDSLGAIYAGEDEKRAHFHMETQSLALADIVISPSHYMVDWLRKHGVDFPAKTYVQPNILPVGCGDTKRSFSEKTVSIREIVFFGRLEFRKGLEIFCNACDQLTEVDMQGKQISFLGNPVKTSEGPTDTYIENRAKNWRFPWKMISDKGHAEAQTYLAQDGMIAVVPSLGENSPYTVLECLGSSIPLIASNAGGIPELIATNDVERICFRPESQSLLEKMRLVFKEGIKPARPAVNPDDNRAVWLEWHRHIQ